MLASLLLVVGPLLQDREPAPHDRVLEFELTAQDPLLEGRGPARWIDHEARFSGTLHVWTRSDVDLYLRIADESGAVLGQDDDSAGGKAPYLELEVEPERRLQIAVAAAEPGTSGALRLHLVASPETAATRAAAARALDRLRLVAEREAEGDRDGARLLLQEAFGELERVEAREGSRAVARAAWKIGQSASRLEVLPTSVAAFAMAANHRDRTLPPDHPGLLAARANLAACLYKRGDLSAARDLQEAILETRERLLAEDHPDLLWIRTSLARTLRRQGNLAEARVLLEAVLDARERTLDENEPDLFRTRSGLASILRQQGDLAGARRLQEAVLEGFDRILPGDHPDRLVARMNLANTMREQGDLAGARALEEFVLEGYERILPEDHPTLQRARVNLSATLLKLGDLPGARALQEKALRGYERTLPEDHPDVLLARSNLAETLAGQGDLAGALLLREAVLRICERTLPEGHPQLLRARWAVAAAMPQEREPAGSIARLRRVLDSYEETLPEDHPHLLLARANLAEAMRRAGQLTEARALQEAALEGFERIMPADHLDVLMVRFNLALTLQDQGDLEGAHELIREALEGFERALPEDHSFVLMARTGLANAMIGMGDPAGGRAVLESVLDILQQTLSDDHRHLLGACTNLAVTMIQLGNLSEGRALLNEVLDVLERTVPEDHPDALDVRSNVANVMAEMGDLAEARALKEAVIADLERILPEDHPSLLASRSSLALMLDQQGHLSEAQALQEAVVEGYESSQSERHPNLLLARTSLARVLLQGGDLAGAQTLARQAALGTLERLAWASAAFSRRAARAAAEDAGVLLSLVRFFSDSAGSVDSRELQFELVETMRDVASLDLTPGAGTDPAIVELRAEISSARARLGDLLAIGPGADRADETASDEILELTAERDALEQELRTLLVEAGAFTGSLSAAEVSRGLPPNAVAIGFFRAHGLRQDPASGRIEEGGLVLVAHTIAPGGAVTEVELGPVQELQQLAREWRAAVEVPLARPGDEPPDRGGVSGLELGGADEARLGRELYGRLLGPVLAELGDPTETLYVCPADLVHAVPLDALPLGEGTVGDRYQIVNQVSMRRFVAPAEPLPNGRDSELLVIGAVDFGGEAGASTRLRGVVSARGRDRDPASTPNKTFVALPGTEEEVKIIRSLFLEEFGRDPRILTEAAPTKATFRDLAPGMRYLHVATHGWFEEIHLSPPPAADALWTPLGANETIRYFAPMGMCGLAFAGANLGRDSIGRVPGILTAEELAGIDLSACELAVLSACETNVGLRSAGLGIQSLQSALHSAGVRTAITSLWRVDDDWTKELMVEFYRRIWEGGQPKARALWEAKMAIRAKGARTKDWAAWVLSGDPD